MTPQLVTAADGRRLAVRVAGAPSERPAVLCLPGLTRNSKDFAGLAAALSSHRRVLAMDFRGRGESDYDPTGTTYRPDVYAADVVAVLDAFGLERACLIGTSLGGLVAMTVALTHGSRLCGVVLNDVGPRLEPAGYSRIQSYAGKLPPVATWAGAAAQARAIAGGLPAEAGDAIWEERARQQYREFAPGVIRPDHDPLIVAGMAGVDPNQLPEIWPAFAALRHIPTLVLRGELSDVLSEATVDEMVRRKPDLRTAVIAGRGHAPTLDEPASRDAILDFVDSLAG